MFLSIQKSLKTLTSNQVIRTAGIVLYTFEGYKYESIGNYDNIRYILSYNTRITKINIYRYPIYLKNIAQIRYNEPFISIYCYKVEKIK